MDIIRLARESDHPDNGCLGQLLGVLIRAPSHLGHHGMWLEPFAGPGTHVSCRVVAGSRGGLNGGGGGHLGSSPGLTELDQLGERDQCQLTSAG